MTDSMSGGNFNRILGIKSPTKHFKLALTQTYMSLYQHRTESFKPRLLITPKTCSRKQSLNRKAFILL